nr:MAG TPA: hypothetical protein [Caudoviricetes sp.]
MTFPHLYLITSINTHWNLLWNIEHLFSIITKGKDVFTTIIYTNIFNQ